MSFLFLVLKAARLIDLGSLDLALFLLLADLDLLVLMRLIWMVRRWR